MTAPINKGLHEDIEMSHFHPHHGLNAAPLPRLTRLTLALSGLALVAACGKPLDYDLRSGFGNAPSTAEAALAGTAPRPNPDDRGIISYPNYQVAVARRGDTVAGVAQRIGVDPAQLARHNGIQTGDTLRDGEILSLPGRVAEPSAATGARAGGPLDITALAGNAITRAGDQRIETSSIGSSTLAPAAQEPVRHKVTRGETAYTVARLYNVSVRSLADWNGLGSSLSIREGQFLLIPVASEPAPVRSAAVAPGTGSPTPTPPSSTKPLPLETPPAAIVKPIVATPDLSQPKAASTTRLGYPVQGKIIREYTKGKSDGIDISASAGTAIKAAEAGTVAAITEDADKVPIIVVKHPNNLLTVYANVDGIKVSKGDSVKRGQQIASIRSGTSNYVHFEVRNGFDSVDPLPYLR